MMIRKLSKQQQGELLAKKENALKEVKGGTGFPDLPGDLHDLLCSTWCEEYCGLKPGSDGIMWVGNRDIR